MQTLSIFRAGNSAAVTIPKPLLNDLGLRVGQKVVVEKVPDTDALLMTPAKKKREKTKLNAEFKKWLAAALKEDAGLLDELADR